MNPRTLSLLLPCLIFWSTLAVAQGTQEKAAAAATTAKEWLGIVDAGDYPRSWREAADYFKKAVAEDTWSQSLQAARKPLGKLISRKIKSTKYATSLPGAPDGEYVVVQFETSFTNKRTSIETVTPMLEKDGRWRVSGYYIK